jgi:hypothetical protein
MTKKILAFCAALVAFTAIPAVAAASPVLTAPTGTAAAVGSSVTGVNTEAAKFTYTGGEVICTTADLGGKVTVNNGTQVEGNIESASFKGTEGAEELCSSSLGPVRVTIPSLPLCWRTTKIADQVEMHGGACGKTGVLTFILHIGGPPCSYARSSMTGTYTTHPEEYKFTFSNVNFPGEAGNSFLCPTSVNVNWRSTITVDGMTAYAS